MDSVRVREFGLQHEAPVATALVHLNARERERKFRDRTEAHPNVDARQMSAFEKWRVETEERWVAMADLSGDDGADFEKEVSRPSITLLERCPSTSSSVPGNDR